MTTQHQVADKECKMLATLHYNVSRFSFFFLKAVQPTKGMKLPGHERI